MAVLSREELLNAVNSILKDNNSDEALSFIENITETYDKISEQNNTNEIEKLREEIKTTDAKWRERYKARFFNSNTNNDDTDINDIPVPKDDKSEDEEHAESVDFTDLFKTN